MLLRWVGMEVSILALFTGYPAILFGRRGFPDWFARTVVIDAPQLSVALQRQAGMRARRHSHNGGPPRPEESAQGESVADHSRG